MAVAVVRSRALAGASAPCVVVEVQLAGGLPAFNLVGLPEAEVREAAPDLAPAFADIGPLAADTVQTVKEISGLPSLRKLLRIVILGGPMVPGLEASVRNLVRCSATRPPGPGDSSRSSRTSPA